MHTAKPNKNLNDAPPAGNSQLMSNINAGRSEPALVVDNEIMIRQIISTDPQKGCEMIFRKYYQPLCGHVVRFVYSREIAEDIVSEVFLNFWNNKLYDNITSSYRVYLYTAVRNRAINHLKMEFKDLNRSANENMLSKDTDFINPETILLYDELFSTIEKIVNSLPPQCRRVFILSRFEGKKYKDIALELQIKLKTVEAHMMKALALLKKSLQEYLKTIE